jgi:uncharacterized damage-inducible protein DinB
MASSRGAKTAKRSKKKREEPEEAEAPEESETGAEDGASGDADGASADADEAPAKSKRRAKKSQAAAEDDAPADESDAKPSDATKTRGKSREPIDLANAVLQALATNERMNQFLLEHLDDRAWNAPPPSGRGRTIAAIVSHMHNVRHMWLVVAAKGELAPEKLDRKKVKKPQAMKSLAESHAALQGLFERSLEAGGHVKEFKPDAVGFLGYVIAHEAHHRGQICMLARELGFALSQDAGYGMWDWKKRWQEIA